MNHTAAPTIVSLHARHHKALRAFVQDFNQASEPRIPAYFPDHDTPADQAAASMAAWEKGQSLKEGWVPCTTRFAQAPDGTLLGVVNVRHHLNQWLELRGGHIGYSVRPAARRQGVGHLLMRAGLEILTQHGVTQALLTCNPDNPGSIRIIEAAGGVFQNEIQHPDGSMIRRYLVPVPNA